HYVGDVHQPLHISFADDKGGNSIKVKAFGESSNLHAVWDTVLIRIEESDWLAYADDLRGKITPQQVQTWQASLHPLTWANESLMVTRDVYVELLAYDGELAAGYSERNVPIIERRLQMAGVRLAGLLNSILGEGKLPWDEGDLLTVGSETQDSLSICSFNIKWLGHYKSKEDEALAQLVGTHDIVLVQEMVAPPTDGVYPDGTAYTADLEAREFCLAMKDLGYDWVLSTEDTGPGEENHSIMPKTEWWIAFYQPDSVTPADDLPHGWLAEDRSAQGDFDRVPYAFAFREVGETLDFVLVSVHLAKGDRAVDQVRRAHEMQIIADWMNSGSSEETDFLIVGDMNIKNAAELTELHFRPVA
ncbi:MAG: hypothetical protein HQ519_15960, partial [Planctomycetes bacterium]|nr:hypothetical protein [Planctomycetota bacterium]